MPNVTIAAGPVYSQHGEQEKILEAVGSTIGRCLEIGSYDGLAFSNTLALIERGWSGVLIEPGLDAFKALLERHGRNEKLTLVHAAVGCNRGLIKFWNSPDVFSTTETGNFEKWKKQANFSTPYWVPQLSIDDLLDKFSGYYDVLSIDTEGSSVAIFSALMRKWNADWPKVIVVEHDGNAQTCVNIVGARYEVVEHNMENLVLVRR